jgi:hypothetical protein
MIAASGAGDVAVMELLLSRGANIDEVAPGAGWRSPLVAAVAAERLESVKFLIDRGVDINRIYNDVSVNGFNVEIPKFTIQLLIVLLFIFRLRRRAHYWLLSTPATRASYHSCCNTEQTQMCGWR